jgi:NTE family protein
MELNPRGIIVIRASPKPVPGKVRTFGDLIQIGLRAVGILQQEVSMNDLANATLINDMIAVRGAQFRALDALHLPADKAAEVMKPLDLQLARYRFVPNVVIEPEKEFLDTLEFDPAKIAEAMEAGRATVGTMWESIEPLLT